MVGDVRNGTFVVDIAVKRMWWCVSIFISPNTKRFNSDHFFIVFYVRRTVAKNTTQLRIRMTGRDWRGKRRAAKIAHFVANARSSLLDSHYEMTLCRNCHQHILRIFVISQGRNRIKCILIITITITIKMLQSIKWVPKNGYQNQKNTHTLSFRRMERATKNCETRKEYARV